MDLELGPKPRGIGPAKPTTLAGADKSSSETALVKSVSAALIEEGKQLDTLSRYKCDFDYGVYRVLEKRFEQNPVSGGIVFKSPFRLTNAHPTCQQCLYSFEVDTYGRGCIHDCVYCYAKAELTVHGRWNKPIPLPADINIIRRAFFTVFETDKKSKWRTVLEKRIPLRVGSMSDSFMFMDKRYKVTQELLRILRHYDYPYVIFTRSDLVADDEYMQLMDPKLAAIHMSLSSIDDELNKKLEPGAPSAVRRLAALKKLSEERFWTVLRINPLFPTRPDGFFTDPEFKFDGPIPEFNYSTVDLVDAAAEHKIPAVLVGFARLSSFGLNRMQEATGIPLRTFFDRQKVCKSPRDWHYSDKEIAYYYGQFKARALKRRVQLTTCYIGNGESHFWKFQDMWSNKSDCCNIRKRVEGFKTDCRTVPFETRLKFMPGHTPVGALDTPLDVTQTNVHKLPVTPLQRTQWHEESTLE